MNDKSTLASNLVSKLREAASEIAAAGHNGWGNTCTNAAEVIEDLEKRLERRRDSLKAEQEREFALRAALKVAQDRLVGCGGVVAAINEGLSVGSSEEPEVLPKCAKPDVHHPACNCLERERLALKASAYCTYCRSPLCRCPTDE